MYPLFLLQKLVSDALPVALPSFPILFAFRRLSFRPFSVSPFRSGARGRLGRRRRPRVRGRGVAQGRLLQRGVHGTIVVHGMGEDWYGEDHTVVQCVDRVRGTARRTAATAAGGGGVAGADSVAWLP